MCARRSGWSRMPAGSRRSPRIARTSGFLPSSPCAWEMTTGSISTYATRASGATSRAAAWELPIVGSPGADIEELPDRPLLRPGTGRRGRGTPGSPAPRPPHRGSRRSAAGGLPVLGEVILAAQQRIKIRPTLGVREPLPVISRSPCAYRPSARNGYGTRSRACIQVGSYPAG